MKIGFSLGRCIRDIVNDKVAYRDVLFIIAATMIDKTEKIDSVVDAYMQEPGYLWGLPKDKCLAVAYRLWEDNKIIQPRLEGIGRRAVPEHAIWADLFLSPEIPNPSISAAWEQYRLLVDLCSNGKDFNQKVWKSMTYSF